MEGHECYHCKQWIAEGEPHDCWTTTEAALTRDLPEDLRDAWERLRDAAVELGEQRIYASHNSIMFARKACYFFVRPKMSHLEVCVFLGRELRARQIRRVDQTSTTNRPQAGEATATVAEVAVTQLSVLVLHFLTLRSARWQGDAVSGQVWWPCCSSNRHSARRSSRR